MIIASPQTIARLKQQRKLRTGFFLPQPVQTAFPAKTIPNHIALQKASPELEEAHHILTEHGYQPARDYGEHDLSRSYVYPQVNMIRIWQQAKPDGKCSIQFDSAKSTAASDGAKKQIPGDKLTDHLEQVDKYFGRKLEAGGPPGKGPGSGHYEHQKHFQSQMLTNLKVMSRTSHGTAREADRPGLTQSGAALATTTEQNFKKSLDWIEQHKSDPLANGKQVRQTIETISSIANHNLLQPGQSMWRTWDDPKLNYVKVGDLQKSLDVFSQQLSDKLKNGNAIDTAGWVEKEFQHVHPLADGVGRTTMLLAALVLARGNQNPPQYRDRKEHFQAMNSDSWPTYYRSLFPKKVEAGGPPSKGPGSGNYAHKKSAIPAVPAVEHKWSDEDQAEYERLTGNEPIAKYFRGDWDPKESDAAKTAFSLGKTHLLGVKHVSIAELYPSQDQVNRKTLEYLSKADSKEKPIVVQLPNGHQIIVDGHHRLATDTIQGKKYADVDVYALSKSKNQNSDHKVEASSYQHVGTYKAAAKEQLQQQLDKKKIQHAWQGKKLLVHPDDVKQHGSQYGWSWKQQSLFGALEAGGPGSGPHFALKQFKSEWTSNPTFRDTVVSAWEKSHTTGLQSDNPKLMSEVNQHAEPPKGLTKKNLIGYAVIRHGTNHSVGTYVHPDWRRQGIASGIYKLYKSTIGKSLDDGMLTPEGQAFRKGIKAFDPSEARDSKGEWAKSGLSPAPTDKAQWPKHLQKIRIPPAWTDVKISHDPKAALLVTGKDVKGRQQYLYSEKFKQGQAAAKFARIKALDKKFEQVEAKVEKHLHAKDPEQREHAQVTKLIMQTGIRPGSDADTQADKKAYGATTLLGRHVSQEEDGIHLKFIGKKGVPLDIPVLGHNTAKALVERAKSAGDNGELFPSVTNSSLLSYVRDVAGGKMKTKDFRTLLGTRTALKEMDSIPPPTTKTGYKKAVKEVATRVAKLLGNTPTVALQSYIAPQIFSGWKQHANA